MNPGMYDLLIVDDDPDLLQLLNDTFADAALKVQTAGSIAQARLCLSQFAFRIVLSDHNLPDGNGVDFLAELPTCGARCVPILMTGMPALSVAVDAINRGKVYKFVTKPLDLKVLSQAVFRGLEQYAAELHREGLTREIIEHNQTLKREAEAREQRLLEAADRIRAEEEKVEQQQAHIGELYQEIQTAYLTTVTSLTAAIEAKDRYTKGHSERVYYYCSLMANALSLSDSCRNDLHFASVLHDLGKIGIPDSILLKPTHLTTDELAIMASHPQKTEDILRPLPFLSKVRQIIRGHHERFDGTGYPDGLKGDENCLEGRILAVADAYDAMRSSRAYRRALTTDQAVRELQLGVGTQFCPLCVGALLYALNVYGEFAGTAAPDSIPEPQQEDFLRIKPASETVTVDSRLN
jgi:response regulator RpfG family c-di-GMP phosphodiesterase